MLKIKFKNRIVFSNSNKHKFSQNNVQLQIAKIYTIMRLFVSLRNG